MTAFFDPRIIADATLAPDHWMLVQPPERLTWYEDVETGAAICVATIADGTVVVVGERLTTDTKAMEALTAAATPPRR